MLGVFEIFTMIDNIVASKANLKDLDVYFFEPDAGPQATPNYLRRATPSEAPAPTRKALLAATHLAGTVQLMDQPWTAIFAPPRPLPRIAWNWQSIVPLCVGLTMTAMIVGYLLMSIRHTTDLEALTASLRRTTDDLRRNAEKITHMARHDSLTGLPNRVLFQERAEMAVAELGRGRPFSMLCLDLDRFKAVNDGLGHGAGDQLLRGVAERIRSCLRETDTAARLGGDEFAIIIKDAPLPDHAALVARRVIDVVSRPYEIQGHEVRIGVSIGIASAPGDGHDADSLMSHADMALYAAKNAGRCTFRFYDERCNEAFMAGADAVGDRLASLAWLETQWPRGLAGADTV